MLKTGDQVKWNTQNGETHGAVTKVHKKDFVFMGK